MSSLEFSRRQFLQKMSLMTATLAMPSFLVPREAKAKGTSTPDEWKVTGCQWGAVRAKVINGKLAEIKPFEFDKHPTEMIQGIKGILYGESRVRYPMVRLDWLKHR